MSPEHIRNARPRGRILTGTNWTLAGGYLRGQDHSPEEARRGGRESGEAVSEDVFPSLRLGHPTSNSEGLVLAISIHALPNPTIWPTGATPAADSH